MEAKFITCCNYPIVTKYLNGQINLHDVLINGPFVSEEDVIRGIEQVNKNQNYFPKRVRVCKAIFVIEEGEEPGELVAPLIKPCH